MNKNLFLLIVALLAINLVSASIELGNVSHNIEDSYIPGTAIMGWINFSMENEPATTLISAFDNSVTIEDLLDENLISCTVPNPYECTCLPSDCQPGYNSLGSGESTKTYSIGQLQSEVFGIKLNENITKVSDFRFNISSNAGSSCTNPLLVDLLDDGSIDLRITNLTDETCFIQNPWGCFNPNEVSGNTTIGTTPLCEKITVPSAKGFKIGAVIDGTGTASFIMSINGNECPVNNIVESGEISCNVILETETEPNRELEVCISAEEGISEDRYKINFEDNDTCGFIEDSSNTPHDFEIYARPLKYAAPGNVGFHDGLFDDDTNLSAQVFSFIERRYSATCDTDCIIPIKIYSGINQIITVKDVYMDYDVNGLNPTGSVATSIFDINETSVLYTTPFIEYDLDGLELFTPLSTDDETFELRIGDETIENNFSLLNISKVSSIIPTTVAALVKTRFYALTSSNENLTFTWNFGDNSLVQSTSKNSIDHIYATTGSKSLTVNITNALGTTSKTVFVNVIAPFNAINTTIAEYRNKLKAIDDKIFLLSDKLKERIGKTIDTADLTSAINRIEEQYKQLFETESEELVKLMKQLNDLNIPESFDTSVEIKPSKFSQSATRLDLDIIGEFGAGSVETDKSEGYPNAIRLWLEENLDINIESKTYAFYLIDGTEQTSVTQVTLKLTPKRPIDEFYMIIEGDTNNIKFIGDYSKREIDPNHFGLTIRDLQEGVVQTIEFLHPEKIEPINPPVYVSPEFKFLELGFSAGVCNNDGMCNNNENYNNCRADCKPVTRTIIFLIILIILAFIIYIALQEWYKRNYQKHLFKSPSELFNLITFMGNGLNQKLSKDAIFNQLKQRKWSNEQLNYAWKKVNNRRTGMFEIPLFSYFEKRKMKKEMAKRRALGLA